ncbi:hypothetical protein CYMTET_48250 [Cymbomonas tetramitiformis]|uniref:(S)-ureidoglycine aminohydrolase cupin domain-containing protein n=1 Tax=Cymbomonas tetramitiformis TaxID=36881 RepID=A0AAE0BSM5_9CHLO|nr:hypothetical protein CYMTET_48250 [Cymbomonas tetramitiformis]
MPSKPKSITVVKNFGGRRNTGTPGAVKEWGLWDCDPTKTGTPSRQHAYGRTFPWLFDVMEKAYVLEGEATLTADDSTLHGDPVRIIPGDMVTFPKGWRGTWEVHSYLKKHYAFFNGQGLRIDEVEEEEEEEEEKKIKVEKKSSSKNKKPVSQREERVKRVARTTHQEKLPAAKRGKKA